MGKIDRLYKEWASLQPLQVEYQKRLDEKFMLEFNYNSNHIEGNTLTYGQTKLLLMFGKTTGMTSIRYYEEMKAHNVGLNLVKREATDKERPLTETFIRELNRTILVEDFQKPNSNGNGLTSIKVGVYKTRPNSVITLTGEEFQYASVEETPSLMSALIQWYNEAETAKNLSPIELATSLHYRYIRIHPFEDGNGRIARLLVNYVLLRHNYPMIIVRSDDKENYLNVLNQCDVNVGLTPSDGANATLEDIQPFVEYMSGLVENSLLTGIKAAKGEIIEEKGDWKKKLSLKKKELEDAPLYSEELAKKANEKSFKHLIKSINNEFTDFYSFFDKIFFIDRNSNNIFPFSSFEVMPLNYTKSNGIRFDFQKVLSNQKVKELFFDIKIIFENQSYKLSVVFSEEKKLEMDFRYAEVISQELISDFISFIGTELSEFVAKEL